MIIHTYFSLSITITIESLEHVENILYALIFWRGKNMFTTGDKLLNVMKEDESSIREFFRISGVPERTIMIF